MKNNFDKKGARLEHRRTLGSTLTHQKNSLNIFRNRLCENKYLLSIITRRELESRYKGSILGLGWSILTPLLMLGVYTLVFGSIIKIKWNTGGTSTASGFALILYCGLAIYNGAAEAFNGSLNSIIGNPNYVKKVRFPLEILPTAKAIVGWLNMLISFLIIAIAANWLTRSSLLGWLGVMTIALSLLALFMSAAFVASCLGVWSKDTHQLVGFILIGLLYTSPTFYPLELMPSQIKILATINPLTIPIIALRKVVFGTVTWTDMGYWSIYLIVNCAILLVIYNWFVKASRGFADEL